MTVTVSFIARTGYCAVGAVCEDGPEGNRDLRSSVDFKDKLKLSS